MGESDRSKASKSAMQQSRDFGWQLANNDAYSTDAGNAFKGYEDEFNYNDMSSQLDKIFNIGKSNINQGYSSGLSDANRMTAQRQRASGINGGSIAESAMANNADAAGKAKFNALTSLTSNRAGQDVNLMNQSNANKFRSTSAFQGQKNQNVMALLQKLGLIGENIGQQGNLASMQDDTTWGDTLGQLAAMGTRLGVEHLMDLATAAAPEDPAAPADPAVASDMRLKENVKKISTDKRGIETVEFNYKGSDIRYRGVIAQQVEPIIPEAVVEIDGLKHVNYDLIGIPFERI